jgi:hypothetical protein
LVLGPVARWSSDPLKAIAEDNFILNIRIYFGTFAKHTEWICVYSWTEIARQQIKRNETVAFTEYAELRLFSNRLFLSAEYAWLKYLIEL